MSEKSGTKKSISLIRNFFLSLPTGSRNIRCPYCLGNAAEIIKNRPEETNEEEFNFPKLKSTRKRRIWCRQCGEELPRDYVRDYAVFPPVMISTIGLSGHGKTTYFASLYHVLVKEQRLLQEWKGFFTTPLDDDSLQTVKENMKLLRVGRLPGPSPKLFPRPALLRMRHVPRFPQTGRRGDCTLILYDTAGEVFQTGGDLGEYARYVQHADSVIFLVSLSDLEDDPHVDLYELLNVYVIGMQNLGGNTKSKDIVVAYTKADKISDSFAASDERISAYVNKDSYDGLSDLKNYLHELRKISSLLEEFTEKQLKASQFVNAAKEHFRSVSFCLVSSLGAIPDGNTTSVDVLPRRVLDPLLIAISSTFSREFLAKKAWRMKRLVWVCIPMLVVLLGWLFFSGLGSMLRPFQGVHEEASQKGAHKESVENQEVKAEVRKPKKENSAVIAKVPSVILGTESTPLHLSNGSKLYMIAQRRMAYGGPGGEIFLEDREKRQRIFKHTGFPSEGLTLDPTSRKVAFMYGTMGGAELVIINLKGTVLRKYSRLFRGTPNAPSWSPDSRLIAFSAKQEAGNRDKEGIYLFDLENAKCTRLTRFGENPSWLENSKEIRFSSKGKMYLINIVSSRVSQIDNIKEWFEKALTETFQKEGLYEVYPKIDDNFSVSLVGVVQNEEQKQEVLKLTCSFKELQNVKNELEVRPSLQSDPRNDKQAVSKHLDAEEVEDILNMTLRRMSIYGVRATVNKDLEVALKGTVESPAEKEKAFQIVAEFEGIKKIRDLVFVVQP